jgi:hypothetical protein
MEGGILRLGARANKNIDLEESVENINASCAEVMLAEWTDLSDLSGLASV